MQDLIAGYHIWFAREGDVVDGITVAVDAKPDNSPTTNWTRLPSVERMEPQRTSTPIKRMSPSPGKFRVRKVIQTNQALVYNFALQEWTTMTYAEMLFGADKPVAGVYVPNSREDNVRGWWKIQAYNQADAIIDTQDVWGEASIGSYQFQNGLEPYTMALEVLYSELNTGSVIDL